MPPGPPIAVRFPFFAIFIIKNMQKSGTTDYYKKYYLDNKEKHLNQTKQWNKDNNEKRKQIDKDYYNKSYSLKKLDPTVKDSWKESKKKQNQIKREYIDNYKKQHCCVKCNESRYYVLDFHHVDPNSKKFNLGDATKHGLNRIKEELIKCIILCRNCHSEFHHLNIDIKEYLNK
jgi:hypothetical protein